MMGPRQVEQGALFYSFSLDAHVPADHLLRSIRPLRRSIGSAAGARAVLQLLGATFSRSGADDPHADSWLQLRHSF
jgi:hypothetical protein